MSTFLFKVPETPLLFLSQARILEARHLEGLKERLANALADAWTFSIHTEWLDEAAYFLKAESVIWWQYKNMGHTLIRYLAEIRRSGDCLGQHEENDTHEVALAFLKYAYALQDLAALEEQELAQTPRLEA